MWERHISVEIKDFEPNGALWAKGIRKLLLGRKRDFEPSSGCTEGKWVWQRDIWVEIEDFGAFEGKRMWKGTLW